MTALLNTITLASGKSKIVVQPHGHKQTVRHIVMKVKPLTTSSGFLLNFSRTSRFHLAICVQVSGSVRGTVPELLLT
jgi:hypothetical protein